MNSSFEYIGDVKIKVSKKSYKYKNSGTDKLFTYFCKWLAGEHLENDIKPHHIDIRGLNGVTLTFQSIPVVSEFRATAKGPATVITAVILDSNIGDVIANNYYLSLKNSGGDELAIIAIDNAVIEQVKTGRQALVEWTMRVSNREVTANG